MELNQLEVLSASELLKIHEASLKVLSETGIIVLSQRALKLLDEAGAKVDFQKKLVRIPKRLVEDSLSSVPQKYALYKTRSKEIAFVVGDGKVHTVTDGDTLFFRDSKTGKRRRITKADVIQFTRIADALSNIDMVLCPGHPQDVPRRSTILHGVSAAFGNTTKPLFLPLEDLFTTKAVLDIARVVSGEDDLSKHPIMICEFSPSAPLRWVGGAIDPLIETAKAGVPCGILPMPLSGVSAPFTLAGPLVVHNAEMLSGIVITQIVKKGTPILYAQAWTTFDMERGNIIFASPEAVLLRIAGTQLAKLYEIPCSCTGFNTDALCIDVQNGWEKIVTGLCGLLCGPDLLVDFGALDTCLIASNEQLVIDDELFGIVSRLKKGINVSRETLATEIIQQVGPGGSYLCEEHTLAHLRSGEHWKPCVSNRDTYDIWTKKGSLDAEKNAQRKVAEILSEHTIEPLDQNKQREIDRIIEKSESEIK